MTRAGYTVASGFTLLYVVTACCADNDSTPIPCRPLSHSGADTPVLVTALAPHAFFNFTMNQFDARQRYVEDVAGPPTSFAASLLIGVNRPYTQAPDNHGKRHDRHQHHKTYCQNGAGEQESFIRIDVHKGRQADVK